MKNEKHIVIQLSKHQRGHTHSQLASQKHSGPHNVACADVMVENGILVRLFYRDPTRARKDNGYSYAYTPSKHGPRVVHANYTRAMFEIFDLQPVGLMTYFANNLIGQH